MIANFFQSLNEGAVDYLLISGQATVLYGAATFSEDIDLWVNPAPENRERFLAALRTCRATYYKLTPPFTMENLLRGHGFHFVLPGSADDEAYLDVMGVPPRVGEFTTAKSAAQWKETDWGRLHTIGIKDLVELKKTQRLEDYPIISKLTLAYFDQPQCSGSASDFHWALRNIFTLPELGTLLAERPDAAHALPPEAPASLTELAGQWRTSGDVSESVEQQVSDWMQGRISQLQNADRRYWRGIIAELKALRSGGKLMPEGAAV